MIMETTNIVLLELHGRETLMIGSIANIKNTDTGLSDFKRRFGVAVCNHFDVEDFNHDELPDLFAGSDEDDIGIEIDGVNYTVRIMKTLHY
jgi:hypothetical protein